MSDIYTETNPLPMRYPATSPPVKGDHIDIGTWPGGWRFMHTRDRLRFERLTAAEQDMFRVSFDHAAEYLQQR